MRRKERTLKCSWKPGAYMTVEAALVMPMVFMVILFAMYLLFFRYDRCLMEQNLARVLMETGTMPRSDSQKMVNQLSIDLQLIGGDKYLFWTPDEIKVKQEAGKVVMECGGSVSIPFVQRMGMGSYFAATRKYSADLLDETFILRMAGKIKDVTGQDTNGQNADGQNADGQEP